MKIDFDMLETMVASGATGGSILAAWKAHEARKAPKRVKEAARIKTKRANTKQHKATESDIEQHSPTPANTDQRARLFGLRPRLVALGLSPDRAGAMLGQWAKVTRDNAAAIETAIAGAELKQPADPIGYIRAVLQDRSSINGNGTIKGAFAELRLELGGEGDGGQGDRPMRDITPGRAGAG